MFLHANSSKLQITGLIVAGVAAGLCSPVTAFADAGVHDGQNSRIVGGQTGKECSWPSLLMMIVTPPGGTEQGVCSATLVHPKLILYAAHCGRPDKIIFGESLKDALILEPDDIESYKANPQWSGVNNIGADYAYVKLKEPVTQFPTVPIAAGCESAVVEKRENPVRIAGYSSNESTDGKEVYLRWGTNKIRSIAGGAIEIVNSPGSATGCRGDSGGPMLYKLSDGTWRTMGIASTAQGSCGAPNSLNRYCHITSRVTDWVEKESGIDVVPCFDSSGNPTPSAECDALMAYSGDPSDPVGKRSDQCMGAPSKPARDFCKVPKSEESDDDTTSDEDSSTSNSTDEDDTNTADEDSTSEDDETSSDDESSADTPSKDSADNSSSDKGNKSDTKGKTSAEDQSTAPKSGDEDDDEEDSESSDADDDAKAKGSSGGGCRVTQDDEGSQYAFWAVLAVVFGWRRRR